MRSCNLHLLHLLAVALALAGCDGGSGAGGGDDDAGPPPDGAPSTFECELVERGADGAWAPLGPDARAELVLGFQGFLFVEVYVRATGPAPRRVDVILSVTIEGDAPYGGSQPETALTPTADGAAVSEAIVVFFSSSSVGEYVDRTVEIAVKLEGDGASCTTTGRYLLVDDDPCIHTGDEPICPDDP